MFERQDVIAAVKRLAGTDRVVVYDVPEADAPERPNLSSPFLIGSTAWFDFVNRRRVLDDGQNLSIMISLRGLRSEERMLAVNWGTAFANAFLLIEPADPWLDLTTAEGLKDLKGTPFGPESVDDAIRRAYAEWVYWYTAPNGEMESHSATLDVAHPETTLWEALWAKLPETFPAQAFLSSLTLLTLREAELFTGGREVARAIIPFLTRLGMPILYDARHVITGVRELVNAGLAWVQDPEDDWRVYKGPLEPIPAEISDERLAMMVR